MTANLLDDLKVLANPLGVNLPVDDTRDLFYWSPAWRKLRPMIIERDNYECQVCKSLGKVTLSSGAKLIAHHIKPLEVYPELGLDDSNLLTVCQACHNAIHFTGEFKRGEIWKGEWWGD